MRIHARTLLVLSLACAGPVPACASGMQPAAVAELPAAARPEATRIVPASARKIGGFPGRQRSIGERRPVEFAAGLEFQGAGDIGAAAAKRPQQLRRGASMKVVK